jgi:parallel beta-helix repeat protein
VVKNNLFRDNCGGAALWLDINSRDFQVEDNFAIDNDNASGQSSCGETEGIRVEISCFGTVSGNTVYGNAGAQIDLFNSNNMSVSDNRVTGQGSGGFAIRVLSSGRPLTRGGTGEGECASTDGAYHSFNNEITSNVVQLRGGSKSGAVAFDGDDSFDNEFRSNTYLGGRCWSESWVWWDGSSNVATDFLSWQREFNQDMSGACS